MTLTVVGAGTMGGGLARGLLASGTDPSTLRLVVRRAEHAKALHDELGVVVTTDVAEGVDSADVVVLAPKPQDLPTVLTAIPSGDRLVVSLVAGVTTGSIERRLPPATDGDAPAVVRVMTNTALGVGQAMSVLSAGQTVSPVHRATVTDLLGAVGQVVWLPEDQQDAASALAGHGAAYLYFLVEVLTQAGVHNGIAAPIARELLTQTMVGAAAQLAGSGQHPVALREAVMSRGGATIAAFREIERHNVRDALFDAVGAATRRGAELAALAE